MPDHALGRPGRDAGDRRRAPRRGRRAVAAGGPPGARRRGRAGRGCAVSLDVARPRTLAPPARRLLRVAERHDVGAYAVLVAPDPDGPAPDAGQFYMLTAAEGWGGGDGTSAPPARVLGAARPGRIAAVPARGRRSGDRPALRAGARRRPLGARPAGRRLRAAARRPPSAPLRWRGGRRAAGDLAGRAAGRGPPGARAARLSRRGARGGRGPAGQPAGGHGRRVARPPRAGDRAAGGRARRRRARRGLRVRAAGDAGVRAGAVRRPRGAGPARARVGDGLRLRRLLRLRRAGPRGRLPAGLRRRARGGGRDARCRRIETSPRVAATTPRTRRHRRRGRGGRVRPLLRARARPPRRQRLGHLRRDRRPARLRRCAAGRLPVQRVRLQDHHARAAGGQPAAAAVGGSRRARSTRSACPTAAWPATWRRTCRGWPSCRSRWSPT